MTTHADRFDSADAIDAEIERLKQLAARKRRKDQPTVPADRDLLTIREFCARNLISQASYFRLQKEGRGPAVSRPTGGRRVVITREAEAAWRQKWLAPVASEGEDA